MLLVVWGVLGALGVAAGVSMFVANDGPNPSSFEQALSLVLMGVGSIVVLFTLVAGAVSVGVRAARR
jgi:hypothetical protein